MSNAHIFDIGRFDPSKNYVLEASAGTGKTYSIVQIVGKLLLDPSLNLSLKDILIVTYTDKAAGELKSRIREKILEEGKNPALPPEIREKIHSQDADTAPVYTIHSFCENSLKKYGVSAGMSLNRTMLDGTALSAFVSRYVREGNFLNRVNSLLDLGVGVDFENICDTLVKAADLYYLDSEGKEDPSIVALETEKGINFQGTLSFMTAVSKLEKVEDLSTLSGYMPPLDAFVRFYGDCLNETDPNFLRARLWAEAIRNNFASLVPAYKKYRDFGILASLLKYDGSKFRSFLDPKAKKTEENKAKNERYKDNLKRMMSIRDEFENAVSRAEKNAQLSLVRDSLGDFYRAYQEEKEKSCSLDFNDMLRDVRENVLKKDSPLKEKLREEYRYAVIDEFQDTNQKQFDIFSSVFLTEGHRLIVVGDPKQSIYSFQGADIEVYYKAKETILAHGGELCVLNKNYRSRNEMVEASNALFSAKNFYDFGNTEFLPSASQKKGDESYFEASYKGKAAKPFWVCAEKDQKEYAKKAVAMIVDACTLGEDGKTNLQMEIKKRGKDPVLRNASFRDFAVLAQKRSELIPIKNELRKAGIPFLQYKDTDLFFGKECADWIAVVEAVDTTDFTGKKRDLFRKALFTEFFGCSLKDLASPDTERDDLKEIQLFEKWRLLASQARYEDLFDDILVSTDLSKRLSSLNEMQSFGKYRQIGDYAVSYLSAGHSLSELAAKLRNLSAGYTDSDDSQEGTAVRKSTDFGAVQLMTMHASKGLDFPIVISVGQKKEKKASALSVLTYHAKDPSGKTVSLLSLNPQDEEKNLYASESNREVNRLYYVAYTRPRFILMLDEVNDKDGRILPSGFTSDHPEFVMKIDEALNGFSFKDMKDRVGEILSRSEKKGEDGLLEEQNEKIRRLIRTDPLRRSYKHSYSSLSHPEEKENGSSDDFPDKEGGEQDGLSRFDQEGTAIGTKLDPSRNPLTFPPDYPRGTNIGTTLHEIFELSDFTQTDPFKRERLIERCFREQGYGEIPDSWKGATSEMVQNVLTASFPEIQGEKATGKQFSLNGLQTQDKKAEIEFNFNLKDERLRNFCNGFIDLLFRRGEYYSIIDWKSDRTNDDFPSYAEKDSLKSHTDSSYSIQRTLYSYCLIQWLKPAYPDLSEEEIFQEHFGGIYYVYIRGCLTGTGNGIYAHTWKSFKDLKKAFEKIVDEKIGG